MDTNITSVPDLDGAGAPLGSPVRLPGERGTLPHFELSDDDLHDAPSAIREQGAVAAAREPPLEGPRDPAATAKARPSRRKLLLCTAASILLLAGAGGALVLQRQGLVDLPLPASLSAFVKQTRTTATGSSATPTVVAEVGGPAVPPSPPAVPSLARAALPAFPPPVSDMADFEALKGGSGPSEVGARQVVRPMAKPDGATAQPSAEAGMPAPLVSSLVAMASPGVQASTASSQTPVQVPASLELPASIPGPMPSPAPAPAAAPATVAVAPVAAPAPLPAARPRDPVQTAIDLRAEPMSPRQTIDAVGLVRELGAQLKDTRLTVAQLSATVADLKQQLEARTTEFDSRLTLSEAGTVLAESARAGGAAHPLTAAQPVAPSRASPTPRPAAGPAPSPAASPPPGGGARTAKDFRIQGASPGLAVLNVLSPAGGEAAVLYLGLGDQVPGLGRIKAISQRGTSWVVQTDGGLIQ